METAIIIIIALVCIVLLLIIVAVAQLSMAGIKVKDFMSFIKANEELEQLYIFSKKYEKMTPQEQIIFLQETEKMSNAFDKIPEMIWDDEYVKYREVMDAYRNLKMIRWEESSK